MSEEEKEEARKDYRESVRRREEYEQALAAYEAFLGRADLKTNQLEIEKVKLRLPSLRRQIQLGQGAKQKSGRPAKH